MEPFRIHILGCGSALPTLKHYPTSQIIELRGKAFMIDCGEGAQIQFRRSRIHFGKINAIFISHLHGPLLWLARITFYLWNVRSNLFFKSLCTKRI